MLGPRRGRRRVAGERLQQARIGTPHGREPRHTGRSSRRRHPQRQGDTARRWPSRAAAWHRLAAWRQPRVVRPPMLRATVRGGAGALPAACRQAI